MVIDLGYNTREFSELALKNGDEYCVGIDNKMAKKLFKIVKIYLKLEFKKNNKILQN